MKTFRRIVKLLPPAFVMRIWLDRRYGIKVQPSPWGGAGRLVLALLPYGFTAAVSVRVESDVRLMKYFLPYGRMNSFVRLTYGQQRGDVSQDHGVVGLLRAILPYGLVLWWDAEDARIARDVEARNNGNEELRQNLNDKSASGGHVAENEWKESVRMDRIEAMTLRLMIMTGGKV